MAKIVYNLTTLHDILHTALKIIPKIANSKQNFNCSGKVKGFLIYTYLKLKTEF